MAAEPLATLAQSRNESCTEASVDWVTPAPPGLANPPDPLELPGAGNGFIEAFSFSFPGTLGVGMSVGLFTPLAIGRPKQDLHTRPVLFCQG